MKEILKMCRYYFISGSSSNEKFIVLFLAVSIIAGLFGIPVGCISFCLCAALAAAPEIYGNKDEQRIFAVLPVSRGTVIRGEFAATLGSVLLGQIPSVLFLALCSWKPFFNHLPEKIKIMLTNMQVEFTVGTVAVIAFFAAVICVGFAFLSMLLHIHDMNTTIAILSVIIGIIMIGFILCIILDEKGIIDISYITDFSLSNSQRTLIIIISNVVSVVTGFLCCERTVSRTADKEF